MTISSSFPVTFSSVRTEFGQDGSPSLRDYLAGGGRVPSGTTGSAGAVPSSGTLNLSVFRGTSAFALAYNPNESFFMQESAVNTYSVQSAAYITVNADGTITRHSTVGGTIFDTNTSGPTAWGTPTTSGIGSDYEVSVNISYFNRTNLTGCTYDIFGVGTGVTTGYTSSWYTLSSARSITVQAQATYSGGIYYDALTHLEGTLYIRNKTTLAQISTPIYYLDVESSVGGG